MKHVLFKRGLVIGTLLLFAGAIFMFSGEGRTVSNPGLSTTNSSVPIEDSKISDDIPPEEPGPPGQNVFNIDTFTWYGTIQAAINAANPGNRLFLDAATFRENVLVYKAVQIIGDLSRNHTVDGGPGDTITITAPGVTIQWVTITNDGGHTGINILSNSNFIIGNNIQVCDAGVKIAANNNQINGNNIIQDCNVGVKIDANSNQIYGNTIQYCQNAGIQINSKLNIIDTNIIMECIAGLYLNCGTLGNNLVQDNTIGNSKMQGIFLNQSSDNVLWFNTITGCSDPDYVEIGILLIESSSNTICYNTVQENNEGICLSDGSNDNFIYHNNFVDNVNNACISIIYDLCTGNLWDWGYPAGGNYWSDHVGDDLYSGVNQDIPGPDGIIDTPYNIMWGGQDRYPLKNQY